MDGYKGTFIDSEKMYYESKVNFHRFREAEEIYGFFVDKWWS